MKNYIFSAYKAPSFDFKEQTNNKWVNFGTNNQFPKLLQDLSLNSAFHNAILTSKVNNSVGSGVTYDGEIDEKTDIMINRINRFENFNDFMYKLASDYVLSGGFCFLVTWNKDKSSISELTHIDLSKIRCAPSVGIDEIVETYLYSEDWRNIKKYKISEIKAFDFNKPGGTQLFYYKGYRPGVKYYPLPDYIGALKAIETDAEISKFHLENIKNGLIPMFMTTFIDDNTTPEERKETKEQFIDKFTGEGDESGTKIIVSFAKDKDSAPTVTPIASAGRVREYIEIQENVTQHIIAGHRITSPMLVGLKTEGQLGGAAEILNAHQLYMTYVIEPIQKTLLSKINEIMVFNGCKELKFINNKPVDFTWSDAIVEKILTTKELREKMGYEEVVSTAVEDAITSETITTEPIKN